MIAYGESVRPRYVNMVPDGSVQWDVHEVPSMQAKLYVAPGMPEDAIQMVLATALRKPDVDNNTHLVDTGKLADVYRIGGYAIKRCERVEYVVKRTDTDDDLIAGLSAMRANVTLSKGLESIGPLAIPRRFGKKIYDYRTPDYFACVTALPGARGSVRPSMLMSYEPGKKADEYALPPSAGRENHFGRAVTRMGLRPQAVNWDDIARNTLVGKGDEYVKLDVFARERISF